MKLGIIIHQGTEKEVREECNNLLTKAIAGYGDMIYEYEEDLLPTFHIRDANMKVTFSVSKYFKDTSAIFK